MNYDFGCEVECGKDIVTGRGDHSLNVGDTLSIKLTHDLGEGRVRSDIERIELRLLKTMRKRVRFEVYGVGPEIEQAVPRQPLVMRVGPKHFIRFAVERTSRIIPV